jgi:uncharacterized protein (TIGR03067 family)
MSIASLFVLASFAAAPVPKADPAQGALQGEWKFVTFAKGTEEDPPEDLVGTKFVVAGDKLTINLRKKEEVATLVLDPKVTPMAIDIKVKEGGKEAVVKGIYKLEQDTLTICFGLEQRERPKTFDREKGIGTMVLKKAKK